MDKTSTPIMAPEGMHADLPQKELSDITLSLYRNVKQTISGECITPAEFCRQITGGHYKSEIDLIRKTYAAEGKAAANELKVQLLPGVTFSGQFSERNKDGLLAYSGLLCADVDEIGCEEAIKLKERLSKDAHVVLAYLSARANGIKALFRTGGCHRDHLNFFKAVKRHLKVNYGVDIDESGKDLPRLCFLSSDPDCYVNFTAELLPIPEDETAVDSAASGGSSCHMAIRHTGASLKNASEKEDAEKVKDALSHLDPDMPYPSWSKVLMALHSELGDEGLDLADEWSSRGVKYKGLQELESHWRSFRHDGGITIATVFAMAKSAGWKPETTSNGSAELLSNSFINPESGAHVQGSTWVEKCAAGAELGNALLYASLNKGNRLYDHTAQAWMSFEHGSWTRDLVSAVERDLPAICIPLYKAATEELKAQKAAVEGKIAVAVGAGCAAKGVALQLKEQADAFGGRITRLEKAAAALGRNSVIINSVEIATRYLPCTSDQFDANPMLLNCRNGTLDLATMEFHEGGVPDLMQSKRADVDYDPQATAPKFLLFMHTIFRGSTSVIIFIIQFFGYCLTGKTDGDFFVYAFGCGANGKTTLFDLIMRIFGGYATSIKIECLVEKKHQQGSDEYWRMRMKDARLVLSSEIPEGAALNESQIKDLTGGEKVTARNPYERPVTFEPTHKLVLFGNHKLKVKGSDAGIWRRIRLVPFEYTVPEGQRRARSEIMAELLAERSGILNVLIGGLRDQSIRGWDIPAEVENATGAYRNESDSLRAFIVEELEESPGDRVSIGKLLSDIQGWTSQSGEFAGPETASARRLSAALRQRGFSVEKAPGGMVCLNGYKSKTTGTMVVAPGSQSLTPPLLASSQGQAADLASNQKAL